MDKGEIHKMMTEGLHKTYLQKNGDYGDSFAKSLEKWGPTAALVRMEDKFNRVSNLIGKGSPEVAESIQDTLLDLANYSIMLAMELKIKENGV